MRVAPVPAAAPPSPACLVPGLSCQRSLWRRGPAARLRKQVIPIKPGKTVPEVGVHRSASPPGASAAAGRPRSLLPAPVTHGCRSA